MWHAGLIVHSIQAVVQTWLYPHTLFTRIYVGANAFRAIFPVKCIERECLTSLSSPLVDRTVATLGEVAFTQHLYSSLGHPTPIMLYSILAQLCCWAAVITKNNMYHVYEEYLWVMIAATYYHNSPIPIARAIALLYAIYMVTVDIPTYFFRESHPVSWKEGLFDIDDCTLVNSSTWKYEKLWMPGYFMGASRLSIYLDEMY